MICILRSIHIACVFYFLVQKKKNYMYFLVDNSYKLLQDFSPPLTPQHLDWRQHVLLDDRRADQRDSHGHDVDSELELHKLADRVVNITAPHDGFDN